MNRRKNLGGASVSVPSAQESFEVFGEGVSCEKSAAGDTVDQPGNVKNTLKEAFLTVMGVIVVATAMVVYYQSAF
ncbi:hypothetical protein [Desulforhabdus amnigena]|jgi:hypothetical protein|uniref:Uncharacterized protein n=1 Tax=Desulforhabdus amnigena TaxID=40218 RepID=A0A9W6FT46_9BACT|nr:hypothetical protein [Desulforhabdus amnigena]GLI32945.1 hypothetical protein DAMNIGENAA_03780 [Desulforhabdus amnigena]